MTIEPRTRKRALAALREGRVQIQHVDSSFTKTVFAFVKGNAGLHTVTRNVSGTWTCTCAEHGLDQHCPHTLAVRLVTDLSVATS